MYYEWTPEGTEQGWKVQWTDAYIAQTVCTNHETHKTLEDAVKAAKEKKAKGGHYNLCIERVLILSQ